MASINSTASGYQYTGKSTPIQSLTVDFQLLKIASSLHQQAKDMDKAQLDGKKFTYRAIPIPQKFQHIFGN